MARALVYIHDRRVVLADIATKNLLFDSALRQIRDFTESSLLPLDTDSVTDMAEVDDNGYSVRTDVGQLGAVMYEVVTRQRCGFDPFRDQPPGPARAV